MAFTKVVGAGIHTLSNITSHNINSSGIITATKFVGPFDGSSGDFSGNVTVDGNLVVNGDTTTLNTTLREVELLRVDANSSTAAGIITQTGAGDLLQLFDGSTQVGTITDDGNFGIGNISSPNVKLHVKSTATSGGNIAYFDDSGSGTTGRLMILTTGGTASGDGIKFQTVNRRYTYFGNATNHLTIDNNNARIGIGTNNPATLLEVSGSTPVLRVTGVSGTPARLDLTSAGAVKWSLLSNDAVSSALSIEKDDVTKLLIDSNGKVSIAAGGKVGFATDSNTYFEQDGLDRLSFTIGGLKTVSMIEAGTNYPVLLVDKNGTNTYGTQGAGYNSNANSNDLVIGNVSTGNHGITICSPSSGYGSINFSDGSGGGLDASRGQLSYEHTPEELILRAKIGKIILRNDSTDALVASGGSIGIGTDNPTDILDVNSDSASAVTNMYLRNHANLGGAALNIWTQGTYASPTYKAIVGCSDAGGNIRMGAASNHDLLLLTNNDAKITIKSDGKVGINSTTPDKRLTITTSNEDALLIKNTNTTQYNSARIHLQSMGSATDNITALVHGNDNTGGSNSYFAIESKNSSHSYIKTLMLYKHSGDYWGFNAGASGSTSVRILDKVLNVGGNFDQTSAPLSVTTDANDFGIRLLTGSNVVFDAMNNDSAGNCEVRGYYNNNSGTQGLGFRLEASGETYFNPGGVTGLSVKSTGQTTLTRGSQGGRDSTGNASNFMKIGTWYGIDQTSRLKITIFGTSTYDSNADVAGETIIYISNNANNTMKGHFHSHSNNRSCVQKVAFKMGGGNTNAEVWIKYNGGYSCTQHKVDASEGYWVGADVDTGSTSVPSGATEASSFFSVGTSDGSQSYERFRITSDGKIGINQNNPTTALLEIKNSGSAVQALDVYTNDVLTTPIAKFRSYDNTLGEVDRMVLLANGKVGINETPTIAQFQVRSAQLGGTSGNTQEVLRLHSPDVTNTTSYRFTNYRVSNGTSHSSSEMRFRRHVDATDMGYFGLGDGYASIGYGTAEYFRIASNGTPTFYSPAVAWHEGPAVLEASNGYAEIFFRSTGSTHGTSETGTWSIGKLAGADGFAVLKNGMSGGGAVRQDAPLAISNAGDITIGKNLSIPQKPGFFAYMDGGNQTTNGNNIIPFNQTHFNTGNHFKTSSSDTHAYKFVCPVAGIYHFSGAIWMKNDSSMSHARWQIRKNDVIQCQAGWHQSSTNMFYDHSAPASITIYCDAGDRVHAHADYTIQYWRGGGAHPHSYFSGHFVG